MKIRLSRANGEQDWTEFSFPERFTVNRSGPKPRGTLACLCATWLCLPATLWISSVSGQTNYIPYNFSTIAGRPPAIRVIDGVGTAAGFHNPSGISVDRHGNVYVSDALGHTIRRIKPDGSVSTLAGFASIPGATDGTSTAARFNQPSGLAVDDAGNVYVADTGNHTIRKITAGGIVSTLAGAAGIVGGSDGAVDLARFNQPSGVAVDSQGNLYVADSLNHTVRRITPGGMVTTLAGQAGSPGSADGTGSGARFNNPAGVTVDGEGNVYVANEFDHTIRKITPEGTVTTIAGLAAMPGNTNADGALARFKFPAGVAVDRAGNVFVADSQNNLIRRITPEGRVGRALGAMSQLSSPRGIAVDSAGNWYVANTGKHTIEKTTPAPLVVVLAGGNPGVENVAAGAANSVQPDIGPLEAIAVGRDNTAYALTRFTLNRGIWKISREGVTTSEFLPTSGFAFQSSLAVDGANNLFTWSADWGTPLVKLTPDGRLWEFNLNQISGGSSLPLISPGGIAVDNAGNIYVAASTLNRVVGFSLGGEFRTLAGPTNSLPGSADGVGTVARFRNPLGLAIDLLNNLYVADSGNNAIRKITLDGVVSTLAGLAGVAGGYADGAGRDARFNNPVSVAVDGAGNVYVADKGNHVIRMIGRGGVVSTIGGLPGTPGRADGPGIGARFNSPSGVAVDSLGNVYVADTLNRTVRKGAPSFNGTEFPVSFIRGAGSTVLQNRRFRVRLTGVVGQGPIVISASPDLRSWNPVFTNAATLGDIEFVDPAAPAFSARFYRAATPSYP